MLILLLLCSSILHFVQSSVPGPQTLGKYVYESPDQVDKRALGAELGDFETVCKSNAALFCSSVDVINNASSLTATTTSTTAVTCPACPTPAITTTTACPVTKCPTGPIRAKPKSPSAFVRATKNGVACLHFIGEYSGRYLGNNPSKATGPRTVDKAESCTDNEKWIIEDVPNSEFVTLKNRDEKYLRVYDHTKANRLERSVGVSSWSLDFAFMWKPVKQSKGVWSLQSFNGDNWLSVYGHCLHSVCICEYKNNSEKFRLE